MGIVHHGHKVLAAVDALHTAGNSDLFHAREELRRLLSYRYGHAQRQAGIGDIELARQWQPEGEIGTVIVQGDLLGAGSLGGGLVRRNRGRSPLSGHRGYGVASALGDAAPHR